MARRATAAEVRNLIGNLHRARHSLPEDDGKVGSGDGNDDTLRPRPSPARRPHYQSFGQPRTTAVCDPGEGSALRAGALAGRGSRIRTCDLKYPKLPRYQAALYPDFRSRRYHATHLRTRESRAVRQRTVSRSGPSGGDDRLGRAIQKKGIEKRHHQRDPLVADRIRGRNIDPVYH